MGLTNRHAAIALASAAVMLYEIAITRILSVVLWYHFAFLAVSLAMLGLGVPGVWFALRGTGPRSLERGLTASALLLPLSIVVLFQYGGPLPSRTALATACILLPMLSLGSVVCVLLLEARGTAIGRMYGADLLGATAGALAVVPLMHVVPTPVIIAGTGLLPALALASIGRARSGAALGAAIVALLVWNAPLHLRYTKGYSEKAVRPIYERWTPTARVTVFPDVFWAADPKLAFGWGMGKNYPPRRLKQLWLEQDGSAGTPITRLSGSPSALEHLLFDVTSLGYQLQPADRVSVIGSGGGRDILCALGTGAHQVDAVELNPRIVDLVSHRFGAFSGDVYHLPGVRAVVAEGRSFLTTTPRRYDLLQISLIDSWAATAAGAFALSENYLYTVEAYRLYWSRLTPTGMISTTRWIQGERTVETIRLAHLVRAALRQEGVEQPENHIAIAQGDQLATVLVSRRPFTGALLDTLETVCARRGFYLHWPKAFVQPGSRSIVSILTKGPNFLRDRGIDLSAPIDDRPFFFHDVTIFGAVDREAIRKLSVNEQSVLLLRRLMAIVGVLALGLFFLPFALRGALPRGPGFWRGSLYFALIGLGFMLIELPVIQKMVLYLGHPNHAITVVLAGMLVGAGLGSIVSGRIAATAARVWAVLLPLVLAAAILALHRALPATIGLPWITRAVASFALVSLMGFFMGLALPTGMVRFGDASRAWFWAVNGACGVAASVTSLGLSMTFGFERVLWIGVAAYVLAAPLPWVGGERLVPESVRSQGPVDPRVESLRARGGDHGVDERDRSVAGRDQPDHEKGAASDLATREGRVERLDGACQHGPHHGQEEHIRGGQGSPLRLEARIHSQAGNDDRELSASHQGRSRPQAAARVHPRAACGPPTGEELRRRAHDAARQHLDRWERGRVDLQAERPGGADMDKVGTERKGTKPPFPNASLASK